MAAAPATDDEVAGLGLRLANLRTARGLALGVEVEGGALTVTAERLGLLAPRDVDELLQTSAAVQVRAVLDAVERRPEAAVCIDPADIAFAPLVTRPEKII